MPVLYVSGIPKVNRPSQPALLEHATSLKMAVAHRLHIAPSVVTVFFPVDCLIEGLGEELICRVEGLFENEERTTEIRQKLADDITSILADFAKKYIPQCQLVEAAIGRFDQNTDGFSSRTL